MLRAGFTGVEKVAQFYWRDLTAGGVVGLVHNERATVVSPREQPLIAIFTMIDFSLVVGHSALQCGSNQQHPGFVPRPIPTLTTTRRGGAQRWRARLRGQTFESRFIAVRFRLPQCLSLQ